MSIINKIFNNIKINIVKIDDEIWFKAKSVAQVLGYADTRHAVRDHIEPEDKKKLSDLKGGKTTPLKGNGKEAIYINESGLYSLILGSKLESAKLFKRWVTKEVLPAIRRTGSYNMNHKVRECLTFKIKNENDLHTKTVSFMKKRYPNSIFTASLGENQDSIKKRIDSFNKGLRGSTDLIINNLHKKYNGFAIEFKSPKKQAYYQTIRVGCYSSTKTTAIKLWQLTITII